MKVQTLVGLLSYLGNALLGQLKDKGVSHSGGQALLAGPGAGPQHHLVQGVCRHGRQHRHIVVAQKHRSTAALQITHVLLLKVLDTLPDTCPDSA